jgi:hypothetical protein
MMRTFARVAENLISERVLNYGSRDKEIFMGRSLNGCIERGGGDFNGTKQATVLDA